MKNLFFRGVFFLQIFIFAFSGAAFGQARKSAFVEESGASIALQQATSAERVRGPLTISIPKAYVFGSVGDRGATYCSPSIYATNSSNALVEELIVGIEFRTLAGQVVGRSVSRFIGLKVRYQESNEFYRLEVSNCKGLEGTLKVLRCKYANGDDCGVDIEASSYGTIPLNMKNP